MTLDQTLILVSLTCYIVATLAFFMYFLSRVQLAKSVGIPFAVLGILLGHLLTADSIGPAVGGLVSLLALVSGTWFPLGSHGFLHDIAQFLPSYWLVQASHVSLGGQAWTAGGWTVVAAWTLVLAILARYAYLRDTARV